MVRLVDQQPVRPAGSHAHRLQMREKLREVSGAIGERNPEQARVRVYVRVPQHSHDFGDARCALRVTDRDQHREIHIVAFRIDHAHLIQMLGEAFDEAGRERRLAAAGRPRDKHVDAIGRQPHGRAVEPHPE